MAGKLRFWKEKNGRYWARLSIPAHLRPFFANKTQLTEALGGDRRAAEDKHPAAVARLKDQLRAAQHALTSAAASSDAHVYRPFWPRRNRNADRRGRPVPPRPRRATCHRHRPLARRIPPVLLVDRRRRTAARRPARVNIGTAARLHPQDAIWGRAAGRVSPLSSSPTMA